MSTERRSPEREWANQVANLIVYNMIEAGVLSPGSNAKAVAIAEEEIVVRLALGDYPPRG